jgi:hypothetical protein
MESRSTGRWSHGTSCGCAWQCFYPLWHVVDGDQDVFAMLRLQEWSHEVNPPNVEQLHLKIEVEGHFITWGDASLHLAPPTPLDELVGILIHWWPVEPTLPYFHLGAK